MPVFQLLTTTRKSKAKLSLNSKVFEIKFNVEYIIEDDREAYNDGLAHFDPIDAGKNVDAVGAKG